MLHAGCKLMMLVEIHNSVFVVDAVWGVGMRLSFTYGFDVVLWMLLSDLDWLRMLILMLILGFGCILLNLE